MMELGRQLDDRDRAIRDLCDTTKRLREGQAEMLEELDEAVERVRWEDEVVRGSPGSAMARRASAELDQLRAQVRALTVARDDAVRVELEARAYKAGLEQLREEMKPTGRDYVMVLRAIEAGARARKGEA